MTCRPRPGESTPGPANSALVRSRCPAWRVRTNVRMADKLETGPRFLARRWLKLPHRRARSDLEGDDVLVRGPADPLVIAQDLRRHARHPPGVGVDQAGRIEIQIRPHKPDQETAIRG